MSNDQTIAHDFGIADRCIYCGTTRTHHANVPQVCVPRWSKEEGAPRGKPASAVDDADTITRRLAELKAERDALIQAPLPEDGSG